MALLAPPTTPATLEPGPPQPAAQATDTPADLSNLLPEPPAASMDNVTGNVWEASDEACFEDIDQATSLGRLSCYIGGPEGQSGGEEGAVVWETAAGMPVRPGEACLIKFWQGEGPWSFGALREDSDVCAVDAMIGLYLLPGVCGLGVVLNTMSAVGFSRTTRRGLRVSFPLLTFLVALSVFDAIQLGLTGLIMGSFQWVSRSTHLRKFQAYASFFGYPLMMSANYASIWCICAISLQRYIAICHPLRNLRWRLGEHNATTIVVISAVAVALNLCRYGEFQLAYHIHEGTGAVLMVWLVEGPLYQVSFYNYIMSLSYIGLMYVVPMLLLALLNSLMLATIQRSRRLNERVSASQKKERKSMLMILMVILMFFGCNSLAMAIRCVKLSDADWLSSAHGKLISDLSNLLVSLSSTANPLIYFFFTRRFRDVLYKSSHASNTEDSTGGLGRQSARLAAVVAVHPRLCSQRRSISVGMLVLPAADDPRQPSPRPASPFLFVDPPDPPCLHLAYTISFVSVASTPKPSLVPLAAETSVLLDAPSSMSWARPRSASHTPNGRLPVTPTDDSTTSGWYSPRQTPPPLALLRLHSVPGDDGGVARLLRPHRRSHARLPLTQEHSLTHPRDLPDDPHTARTLLSPETPATSPPSVPPPTAVSTPVSTLALRVTRID